MTNAESKPTYSRLSVIVPVHNERNTVGEAVRRMRHVELPEGLDLEVLVVDDGSVDGTAQVLRTIEDSTVRVVRHDTNRGKGAAIRTGRDEARGDVVIVQGAGLQYDPQDWPRLLAPILDGRAKVVFGSRFHPERVTMPLTSLIADRGVSVLACLLFNTTLTDIETGMKAIDKGLFDSFSIDADRLEFETELAARLLASHHRIYEVPVSYRGREDDQGPTGRSNLAAARILLKHRFRPASA